MRKKKAPFVKHLRNPDRWKWNVLIGVPSLGQVRIEWALGYSSLIMPMNFSMSRCLHPVGVINPLRYHVAEAQNVIVKEALSADLEWDWILFLEDDVCPPPNLLIRMAKWVTHGVYPMVSGLYHLKAEPPEPMTFRGRGNGAWTGWKKGPGRVEKAASLPKGIPPKDIALCDGVPTGCLLISTKLLKVAWDESKAIVLRRKKADGTMTEIPTHEVFRTVREAGLDPEQGGYYMRMGTSDLEFCDKVMQKGWMGKAGFKKAARMKYPFPVDLAISCGHIELSTGRVF